MNNNMILYEGERVTIMCCSTCNSNCKHCYISYNGDIDPLFLEEMCRKLSEKYTLIINGTEVLLNPGYLNSLAISKQKRVLTNGIVIHNNPELLSQIYETKTKSVALSYHYGIHDDISSVAYQTILDDIKLINESGLEVTLMCTISKYNYNKVIDMCEFAVKHNVRSIRFFNYIKIGNALELSDENLLSSYEIEEFFKQLDEARKIYPKEILSIKRNGNFGPDYKKIDRYFCDAGYDEVVIAPNMKVYPCVYMTKEGYEIGEYKDGQIYLYESPSHNRKKCLVKEKFNNNTIIKF